MMADVCPSNCCTHSRHRRDTIGDRLLNPAVERALSDSGSVRDRANIVRVTCTAFLLTLVLSWRAYIPNLRIFALSPVIDTLESTPVWFDWIFLILNTGCLGWLIMKPLQRAPAVGVLVCTVFWVLQDLLRFQPYTYMYVFTICVGSVFYITQHGCPEDYGGQRLFLGRSSQDQRDVLFQDFSRSLSSRSTPFPKSRLCLPL